jgi:hypothetical protein
MWWFLNTIYTNKNSKGWHNIKILRDFQDKENNTGIFMKPFPRLSVSTR